MQYNIKNTRLQDEIDIFNQCPRPQRHLHPMLEMLAQRLQHQCYQK